jgi:hypothetical protein
MFLDSATPPNRVAGKLAPPCYITPDTRSVSGGCSAWATTSSRRWSCTALTASASHRTGGSTSPAVEPQL